MKIAHFSDTHLGGGTLNRQKMVADPYRPGLLVPQQEADIMQGLERAVNRIVEVVQPDLVIHSGDLFDTAQPPPRYVDFAMTQLKRLTEAAIPVVVIEGDHSCPRVQSRGHALRLLQHLEGVHAVCAGSQQVRIGEVVVHALPHQIAARDSLPKREVLDSGCVNVLVTHVVADGKRFFRTGRYACDAPISECAHWYDYVALGHCHRFAQVPNTDRAFYAGATALVTLGDFRPGHLWGFNVVELGASCPTVNFEAIETRPMQAYGLDDASGLSAREVLDLLGHQAEEVPPADAYCQVIVQGLDPLARRQLSRRDVDALFGGASALQVTLLVQELKQGGSTGAGEDDLHARFEQLVAQSDGDGPFKEEVRVVGRGFLDRALQAVVAEEAEPAEREVSST